MAIEETLDMWLEMSDTLEILCSVNNLRTFDENDLIRSPQKLTHYFYLLTNHIISIIIVIMKIKSSKVIISAHFCIL